MHPQDDGAIQNATSVLERKLNKELGFHWWRSYVASAFWSNVSTPINLAIMLLTALTTAQATTESLLPRSSYVGVSIATLVLSVLNTFFRPHEQMTQNVKTMQEWHALGSEFERIYYTNTTDWVQRHAEYVRMQQELSRQEAACGPHERNFMTDLLHLVARNTVLRGKEHWLYMDEEQGGA
jgi:membrane protein required for beta-lactamase induction